MPVLLGAGGAGLPLLLGLPMLLGGDGALEICGEGGQM